ncbi:MAG: DUF58 domain-containing protein, partial [Flavisolibacter sp.]
MFYKFIKYWDHTSFYLKRPVYYVGFTAAVLFVLSYFSPPFFTVAIALLIGLFICIIIDSIILYRISGGIESERYCSERFSNGDDNDVLITIINNYDFKVNCILIDELPFQFQERNWRRKMIIEPASFSELVYKLIPHERGEYNFGAINVFVDGPLK